MTMLDVTGPDGGQPSSLSHTTLQLLFPADPDYDRARRAWNLVFTHRPPLIACPANVDDVLEAVMLARERGLSIAIQSSGHGPVREATEALLIDLVRRPPSDWPP